MARALLLTCWVTVCYGTAAPVAHATRLRGGAAWASTLLSLVTFTLALARTQAVWTQAPFALAVPPPLARLYEAVVKPLFYRLDPVILLLMSGIAAALIQLLAPNNGALVAAIATLAVAGIRLDTVPGRVVAGFTIVGFLAATAARLSPDNVLSIAPGLFFTYLGAVAVRRLRVEQRRTQELLAEVVAGRDARIRAAALDERARLAREMHDVLAHTLSALSIHLEGTRLLAEQRQPSDPEVVKALERAGGLAREGLAEARRAVGSLRGDALPGPDLLPQLASDFERGTGVACRIAVEGEEVELSADARLALYRVAQEALTNVRKHTRASAVTVTLRYAPDGVELIVENDGEPLASPLKGGSYGLRGMRERAELLDGTLDAGPTENGFRVRLWIPRATAGRSAS